MKNYLLILATVLISLSLKAQQYSGEFYNGTTNPGNATYSYYSKNGEKIKHGAFIYKNNIKTDEGFKNVKINGSFKNGNKDGIWSFSIDYKDYNTGAGNIWATGRTSMTAKYSDGIPNGSWNYNLKSKSRSKKNTALGFEWSEYYPSSSESVNANYSNGILTGEFLMDGVIMNDYKNIKGQLDNNGFCIGQWSFQSERKEMSMDFYENVEVKYSVRDKKSGAVIVDSQYSDEQLAGLKEFALGNIDAKALSLNHRIKIDTANWIESRFISLESTFYSKLFLEKHIGGDKTYNSENYKFFKTKRGLYRIFGDTKSMKLIKLSDLAQYRGAIHSLEFNPVKALALLESVKIVNENNLSVIDLVELNRTIKISEEKIDSINYAAENQKAIYETKSRIKSSAQELSNELSVFNNTQKKEIYEKYFQEIVKLSGIGSDYNKINEFNNEFIIRQDFAIKIAWSEINGLKKEAGIQRGVSLGANQSEGQVSLEKLIKIEKDLNNLSAPLKEMINQWSSFLNLHYQVYLSYNTYDKMKSSLKGIDIYKKIKPNIFNNYQKIFNSDIDRISKLTDKESFLTEIEKMKSLSEKVLFLADTDSKALEKELKKITDIEEARKLLIK